MKNFAEDESIEKDNNELPYKSLRYSKKLKCRHKLEKTSAEEFRKSSEYEDKDIWELPYVSSSCEDDNDSEDTGSEDKDDADVEESEEESSDEDKPELTEEEKKEKE